VVNNKFVAGCLSFGNKLYSEPDKLLLLDILLLLTKGIGPLSRMHRRPTIKVYGIELRLSSVALSPFL